jgi:rubrerythrin
MARVFDVAELVQVAVDDEKSGVAFYRALAEKARDPALKQTFKSLADQERRHQRRFEEMLKGLGAYKPPDTYADEYLSYVHALTTDRAFPDEAAAMRKAGECADDDAGIALALRFERDTLVLMNEMRAMVRDQDRAVVDELIAEEQQHVVDLTAARAALEG